MNMRLKLILYETIKITGILFKTLKCRSTGVDWQQTFSDFDVTSTMLNSIANAMYIF